MRRIIKITCILLALMLAPVAVGCQPNTPGGKEGELTIVAARLGYDLEWLGALKTAYTNKTGIPVTIVPKVGQTGNSAIMTEIRSLSSGSDIFFMSTAEFYKRIYEGAVTVNGVTYDNIFADLTDVYTEEMESENGATLKSKLFDSYVKSADVDGKFYSVPWANGIMGLMRNVNIWNTLGMTDADIPLTTEHLFETCDKILINAGKSAATKNVAPFIYSASDEYYTTIVELWFAQYEGKASITNFMNGLDPDGNLTEHLYTYDGQPEALKVLNTLLNTADYQHKSSRSLDFTQMQSYFLLGQAVFCINGSWLDIEMGATYKDVEVECMKMPVASALAKKLSFYSSSAGNNDLRLRELIAYVDAHPEQDYFTDKPAFSSEADVTAVREARGYSYVSNGHTHTAAVSSYSKNLDAAKDFIKFMFSDEGLKLYYTATGGATLPATLSNGSYPEMEYSGFRASINAIDDTDTLTFLRKNKMFTLAGVDMKWRNNVNGGLVAALTGGTTVDEIMKSNQNYMKSNWPNISRIVN